MDPDTPEGGFYRSIVYRGSLSAAQLTPTMPAPPPEPREPTLVGTGLSITAPYFKTRPLAGTAMELWVPIEMEDRAPLAGLTVGVRWDPLDVDGVPADAEGEGEAAETTDPSTGRVVFFQAEVQGSLVEPVPARLGKTRLYVDVDVPAQPGRYRLVTTLHDSAGVAFDAPTQSMVPGLVVQVSGPLAPRYLVSPTATVGAGERLDLAVAVANVGSESWGQAGPTAQRNLEERAIAGSLRAHWVALDTEPGAVPAGTSRPLPAGFAPGATMRTSLDLGAPEAPGEYLLVLDVVVPGLGSLTAHGADPAMVRVTVE
jgi:hypothetical protein